MKKKFNKTPQKGVLELSFSKTGLLTDFQADYWTMFDHKRNQGAPESRCVVHEKENYVNQP